MLLTLNNEKRTVRNSMQEDSHSNVCVQMEKDLVSAVDRRIEELRGSGRDTDRSKFVRRLIRRDPGVKRLLHGSR